MSPKNATSGRKKGWMEESSIDVLIQDYFFLGDC